MLRNDYSSLFTSDSRRFHPLKSKRKKIVKGLYLLVLRLKKSEHLSVGRLPKTTFLPGIYLYVGRSKKGLAGRIRRHLRKEKKLFWHIDYFLQKAEIDDVWWKANNFDECQVANHITTHLEESSIPLKKFGSSDCRCPGHLIFIPDNLDPISLIKKMSFQRINRHEYML
jgi:Uri superfamily endonuclease